MTNPTGDALKASAAQVRIENVAKALAGAAWKRLNAGDSAFAKMKYPDGVSQYMEEQWRLYEADALDVLAALSPVEQAPQPVEETLSRGIKRYDEHPDGGGMTEDVLGAYVKSEDILHLLAGRHQS